MSSSTYVITNETRLRVLMGRLCLPVHGNVRAMMPPRHAAGDLCLAHPPTDLGTEKQRKICCRCCTAVVVHGGTCYKNLCWVHVCQVVDFSSSTYVCGIRKHTHNNIEYSAQRAQGLNQDKPSVQRRWPWPRGSYCYCCCCFAAGEALL